MPKRLFVLFWLWIAVFSCSRELDAQKLYMFTGGDVHDQKIGSTIGESLSQVESVVKMNMPREYFVQYNDPDSSADEWNGPEISESPNVHDDILNAIASCPAGPDDTIFFYWCGHGAFDKIEGEKEHYLVMPNSDGKEVMFRSEILRALKKKRPRLIVFITDSCNVFRPAPGAHFAPPPEMYPGIPPLFASLFFDCSGIVDANSSDWEQSSAVTSEMGCVFSFWFSSLLVSGLDVRASWEDLFDTIDNYTENTGFHQTIARWSLPESIDAAASTVEDKTAETTLHRVQPGKPFDEGSFAGEERTMTVKGVDYTFRWCPPGEFMMGSPDSEEGRSDDESLHQVTLDRGFWLLETEVTQEMWESIMGGTEPGPFSWINSIREGVHYPVYNVDFDDAVDFCRMFSLFSENEITLPTEEEWEYACRAGTSGSYAGTGNLEEMGWYQNNGNYRVHEIKGKNPNAWGLFDMHGNIAEWCANVQEADEDSGESESNGEPSHLRPALRGGGWLYYAKDCRSAYRNCLHSADRFGCIGLRLVLIPEVKGCRNDVENGSAEMQLNLGVSYESVKDAALDKAESVKWYRRSAEQGDADAQFNLGVCFFEGEGVAQDYAEAVKWFRLAAEQGHAGAQNRLGVCYFEGKGFDQDYAEAVKWFRSAAEQGHAGAQNMLGVCYDEGKGVDEDDAEAVHWYTEAAEQGNPEAELNLGKCYQYGKGVDEDERETEKWLLKAVEHGGAEAEYALGSFYEDMAVDLNLRGGPTLYRLNRNSEQFQAEAVNWYLISAGHGNRWALNHLPSVYLEGTGVEPNIIEEAKWQRKSMKRKNSAASAGLGPTGDELGNSFNNFKGAVPDLDEVTKLFPKAYIDDMKREHVGVRNRINVFYTEGAGVDQFYSKRSGLILQNKNFGGENFNGGIAVPANLYTLGVCYSYGYGVDRDDTEAMQWFKQSAKFWLMGSSEILGEAQETSDICYALGADVKRVIKKDVDPDRTGAVNWVRQAAEQGDNDARYILGVCYATGIGIEPDDTEAVNWFRQAAEQGEARAQYALGLCYAKGKGVDPDDGEAARWFLKGAEQGDAGAQYLLGVCCYFGKGVDQDFTEAVNWYRRAAGQGHAIAQYTLGNCYRDGKEVSQDFTEAVKYYRQSAEQGVASAQYALGVCYAEGNGIEQDFAEAARWLYEPAARGNTEAQVILKRCKELDKGVPQNDGTVEQDAAEDELSPYPVSIDRGSVLSGKPFLNDKENLWKCFC